MEVNRHDPLFWRDWFETKERGRARLGLNDGSVINVGSQARLQVLEHEQAAETTELLLQAGKARTWIRRQSTPGRKFQVRTNAAVIGFIGTHVYVESTETLTTVINVSGQSSIRSADETITEQVLLDAFEAVDVEPGKPPGPKRKVSWAVVLRAIMDTLPGPVFSLNPSMARAGSCMNGMASGEVQTGDLPFGTMEARACAVPGMTLPASVWRREPSPESRSTARPQPTALSDGAPSWCCRRPTRKISWTGRNSPTLWLRLPAPQLRFFWFGI